MPWPSAAETTDLAASFPQGQLLLLEGASYDFSGESPMPALIAFLAGESPGLSPSDDNLTGGRYPLSAREREVLALVAAGKTDAQIADALCIAPATASRHVHNVLNKLGMRRRSEAAAWWAAYGNGLH